MRTSKPQQWWGGEWHGVAWHPVTTQLAVCAASYCSASVLCVIASGWNAVRSGTNQPVQLRTGRQSQAALVSAGWSSAGCVWCCQLLLLTLLVRCPMIVSSSPGHASGKSA